jgi:NAD+ synthase
MIIDYEKVTNHIINWIRDYTKAAGKSSLVVGLSDVDSALLALLCKKTNIQTICIFVNLFKNEEDRTAIDSFASQSHIWLSEFNLKDTYKEVQSEIDYHSQLNEYAENRAQYFNVEGAKNLLRSEVILPIISTMTAGFNGLIIGSRSKNELLYRNYNKYGAGNADIFPLLDLYKSEIYELFEYVASPMCYGAIYLLDRAKNKVFNDITDLEVEWADSENIRTGIITSDISPDKQRDWQRYTLRQRQIIARLHQLEKLSRHKVNTNLPYCNIRKIDGLVR